MFTPSYEWSISSKGIIGILIFSIKRHIDLEPLVYQLIRGLTSEAHLVEFIYKIEEFINNLKHFNFFIHSSLTYFLTDGVMRKQIEAGKMERVWIERVIAELSTKTRPFDMGIHPLTTDLFYGICILIDYWNLVGLDFTGTNQFGEIEIIESISHYILKSKGNNRFKETFKFYIKSTNMKIIILGQLFRIYGRILEPEKRPALESLETEKERDKERERAKERAARVKLLSTKFLDIFVNFIFENLENVTVREYISENLVLLIKQKKISFEPYFNEYMKQMVAFIGLNHHLNLFDMNFMMVVINNTSLEAKKAFSILGWLENLFFLSISQAPFLLMCMTQIFRKVVHEEEVLWF